MELPASSPLLDDRFLLLEALGRGGSASVFRAFDRRERRLVAVKVPACGTDPDAHRGLASEFEAWRRLRHPNVIRALELGRARRGPLPQGIPYLVLESFGGGPAHQVLAPGRAAENLLETLAGRALAALDHVHRAGLVHRDLKPANLLVDAPARGGMRVKLTDFGLAVDCGRAGEPGLVSGSLPFVAPEALVGLAIDGRADLYALGVLLAFLATGRMPADGPDPAGVLRWHLAGPPWEESDAAREVGPRLRRFVARLLERDRARRPASAHEALALLGASVSSRPVPPSARVPLSDRAALRLAFDAARRGEGRTMRLPRGPAAASALVEEAQTLAQLHGAPFGRLGPPEGPAARDLARLVLGIVETGGAAARDALLRHGLHRQLPIAFVGGVPVRDRSRPAATSSSSAAAAVAAFLREAPGGRPLVLIVERGAGRDPVARRTVARLVRNGSAGGSAPPAAVLLLAPGAEKARSRPRIASPAPEAAPARVRASDTG